MFALQQQQQQTRMGRSAAAQRPARASRSAVAPSALFRKSAPAAVEEPKAKTSKGAKAAEQKAAPK